MMEDGKKFSLTFEKLKKLINREGFGFVDNNLWHIVTSLNIINVRGLSGAEIHYRPNINHWLPFEKITITIHAYLASLGHFDSHCCLQLENGTVSRPQ